MKTFHWQSEFTNYNREWKTQTMLHALKDLSDPHLKLPHVIHVAGTNGKGSTVNFIRAILETAGREAAMYTSPHLVEYNERFYVGGRLIADDEIEYYRGRILAKCSNVDDISYFEASTLIAIMFFADNINNNDGYCLFEVGLGGRLDATNIFDKPLACAITSISLDHMDKLGNSKTAIAMEKAGIIKHNVPVWCANEEAEVVKVVKNVADEKQAPLFVQGRDYKIDYTLKPSLDGKHQYQNATLAKEICKYFGFNDDVIRNGVSSTFWAGRLQKVHINYIDEKQLNIDSIYLDGAHNEGGVRAICDFALSVKRQNSKQNVVGVFACLKRKDYMLFFPLLSKSNFDKIYFYNVPKNINDFVSPEELNAIAKNNNVDTDIVMDMEDLQHKLAIIKNDYRTTVIFFGSLYFIGYLIENYLNKS